MENKVSVSIVSHGHGSMVSDLVSKLVKLDAVSEIIVTLNLEEQIELIHSSKMIVLTNDTPKGFGENHNYAFQLASEHYFCVLNPDIDFIGDPFKKLLDQFAEDQNLGLTCPAVYSVDGVVADSVRRFPSFVDIPLKLLKANVGKIEFENPSAPVSVDWCAGMFMLFSRNAYMVVQGFDESFYLYYEDVDICARLWRSGISVACNPAVSVIHDARRDSRKHIWYFVMHLKSLIRYFFRYGLKRIDSRVRI